MVFPWARQACSRDASETGCPTTTSSDLYRYGPPETFRLLQTSAPATAQRILVVGHEPTCSEVVRILTGANVRFPTAAIARIDLDLRRWDSLAANRGQLAWLVPPRLLAAAQGRAR